MENHSFAICSNATFQARARALNLPLLRLHSQWGGSNPSVLANCAANIQNIVPSGCTMVIGISLGVTQAQAKAVSDYWAVNASSRPCSYWEGGNENGLSASNYQTQFVPISAGVRQTNAANKAGGPCYAGSPGGSYSNSLIGLNTASSYGFLDYHDYLYCQGVDTAPSNAQMCQALMANGTDRFATGIADVASGAAGTYAANYPIFVGEYNTECGAGSDLRAGTCIGAAFMTSALLKMAAASSNPVWGGVWDLFNDAGAAYQLIDSGFNVYPQYYTLQRLIAKMPGSMATVTVGQSGVLAWASKSGTTGAVAIVNSNSSSVGGPVALSHWPAGGTGNGTATLWTYPTTDLVNPTRNTPGTTTGISVSAGWTASITVPGNSVAILSDFVDRGGGGGGRRHSATTLIRRTRNLCRGTVTTIAAARRGSTVVRCGAR
jgi:hypothetical protein